MSKGCPHSWEVGAVAITSWPAGVGALRTAQLDAHWMPASPNILFFFELLTGETGKSCSFFSLLPVSGNTKNTSPAGLSCLSLVFRS